MRKKIVKFLCGMLVCLTLFSTLTACSVFKKGSSDSQGNSDVVPTDTDVTETEEIDYWGELPKNSYGGVEFKILQPKEHFYEFAEGLTGDPVNNAVYMRDSTIEETYDVDLIYLTETLNWQTKSAYNSLIRDSIISGVSDGSGYNLVNGMISYIMPLTVEGLFHNYGELEGIDFGDPWWIKDIYNNLHVADKLYAITGSSMLSVYKGTYVMYANKTLIEKNGLEDPIELVLDRKWTLEKLLKMTMEQGEDINGDGEWAPGVDAYGFISSDIAMRGFQTAFNLNLINRSDEGRLSFVGGDARYYRAVDTFKLLVTNPNDAYILKSDNAASTLTSIFAANRAVIFNETLGTAEVLSTVCDNYVILPQPMYDESQGDYDVQMGTSAGMFVIPMTSDAELAVDILNAHGCLNYRDVVPEYYNDSLKTKYVQDPRNKEIIDIISNNMVLDITYAHNYTMGKYLTELFCNHTYKGVDAASSMGKLSDSMSTILNDLYDKHAALE